MTNRERPMYRRQKTRRNKASTDDQITADATVTCFGLRITVQIQAVHKLQGCFRINCHRRVIQQVDHRLKLDANLVEWQLQKSTARRLESLLMMTRQNSS